MSAPIPFSGIRSDIFSADAGSASATRRRYLPDRIAGILIGIAALTWPRKRQ